MRVAACCAYYSESLIEPLALGLARQGAQVHLWALDEVLPAVAQFTRGSGPLPRSLAFNRLLPHAKETDLVLFVDDDVRLEDDFLSRYLAIVKALGASVAQPARAEGSSVSHEITRRRPGRWARLTDFVEIGPVFSMSREFLRKVTPFPESNPMGWGLEAQWSAVAQADGDRMAIVDACPVDHSFRPVGAKYSTDDAWADMWRFLAENHLPWSPPRVLREFGMIPDRREAYLAAFPAPQEAVAHGIGGDMADDLPLLWAVASLVRPEVIVELGTGRGVSTRTLCHAAGQWGGRVVTADEIDSRPFLPDLSCEFVHKSGRQLYRDWTIPVKFLLIDTDPHSYRQTREWLDTWVKAWLDDGGVAVFHDVVGARPEIRVAEAVRDWLREQPSTWRWQEFQGTWGLGLLWRVAGRPDFEALTARAAAITGLETPRGWAAECAPAS